MGERNGIVGSKQALMNLFILELSYDFVPLRRGLGIGGILYYQEIILLRQSVGTAGRR